MAHETYAEAYIPRDDAAERHTAQAGWTHAEVLEEMDRILRSQLFAKSLRLSRFLRTAVQYLLEGRGDMLKEYTVGVEVYERQPCYDPTQDSIVRTEARRLRAKLKEYYSLHEPAQSVMILFVAGSYVPLIQRHSAPWKLRMMPQVSPDQIRVAVPPFRAGSADSATQLLAQEAEDELTHRLAQQDRLQVFRVLAHGCHDSADRLHLWRRSKVSLLLNGCVRGGDGLAVVSLQLTTLSGMLLWSRRMPWNPAASHLDDFGAEIAAAIFRMTAHGVLMVGEDVPPRAHSFAEGAVSSQPA